VKSYDIRKKDIVRFRRKLSDENRLKISKFVKNNMGSQMTEFVLGRLKLADNKNAPTFTVLSASRTPKYKIAFAMIRDNEHQIDFPIQERYLKVLIREARHPLTKVFV
jgi:hypothetical protein